MAQEVGAGYVTLMPSARGFGKNVEKEMGGAWDASEKRGSSTFSGLFKKVVGFASAAAVAVGGYFSAKKIFGGGLDRLLNIEDAQAKLKGLGHDANSVSTIMTSALDAVRGTAYGLDSAATVAASAVAAGIKPGTELTKYLTLTADAATIAGASLGDMGTIMNQVTSAGRAYTQDMNQLVSRGIPIYQWLANEYGVTADELRKMVERGEVDSETFRRVIEENIGGAALASGDTTRGAMANMGAALSRIGANLMSGVFPLFREAFQGMTTMLGPVEEGAKRVGEAFGAWATGTAIPVAKGIADSLRGIVGVIKDGDFNGELFAWLGAQEDSRLIDVLFTAREGALGVADSLRGIVAVLAEGDFNGGLFAWAGVEEDSPLIGVLLRIRDTALGIVPAVTGAFSALVAGFQSGGTDIASSGITGLFETIGAAARNFIDPLIPAFSALWAAIEPILPQVMQAVGAFNPLSLIFKALLPILPTLTGFIGELVGTLVGALGPILVTLVPALAQVAEVLVNGLAQAFAALLPIVPTLVGLVASLAQMFSGVLITALNTLVPILVQLVTTVLGALTPLLPTIANLIGVLADVFLTLVSALMPLLPPILQLVGTLASALMPLLPTVAQLLTTVAGVVIQLISALAPLLPTLTNLISIGLNALLAILTPIIDVIAFVADIVMTALVVALNAIMPIVTGVIGVLAQFAEFMTGVIATAVQGMADVISTVWNGIRAIAQGVWNAIKAVILTPVLAVKDAVIGAFDLVKSGVEGAMNGMKSAISAIFGGLVAIVKAPINGIISLVNMAIDAINDISIDVPDWVPGIGGSNIGFNIPRIPMLATGATVLPRQGGTLALLAEAGRAESVVDTGLVNRQLAAVTALALETHGLLSADGANAARGGDTYNITTSDPLAVATEVARRHWLLGV